MDEIRPGYVAVGRVIGAWGVRGELKVEPLGPESVVAKGHTILIAGCDYETESGHRSGRFLRVKLAGVDTREDAQALRGAYLEAREADLPPLPEGQFYRFQLIGLAVRSVDGDQLGRVTDILSAPENDVYVVNGPHGEVLIPAVEDVVREIDVTAGAITIEIIPGLLP